MFKIYDGREKFYQWDLDRKLIVEDAEITEVHFCNRTDDCSLVCQTYSDGELQLVDVPNVLLQNNFRINVYAFDRNYTKHAEVFNVVPRTKPADYVYTEEELKTWEELDERIDQIEEQGISDEAIENAINNYLDENPIETGATEEEAAQIAANTAAIEELQKIEIPVVPTKVSAFENDAGYITQKYVEGNYYDKSNVDKKITDLNQDIADCATTEDLNKAVSNLNNKITNNYATKTYVDDKVANVKPDLTGYATTDYVDEAIKDVEVDTTGLATEEFVLKEIAEAQLGGDGEGVDLSAYYTKTETDAAIQTEIGKIDIPTVPTKVSAFENDAGYLTEHQKLDNYYTKDEVDTALENVEVDLTDYALKSEIPSVAGLATEKYVDDKVAAIPKTDLTGYATEKYVDDAIAAIDIPEGGEVEVIEEVYVGTTEPTNTDALIWINPEGSADTNLATTTYVDEAIAAIELTPGPQGEQGIQGIQGEPGKDGEDGYTPVKGVDYYTEAEKQEIINAVLAAIPSGEEVSY